MTKQTDTLTIASTKLASRFMLGTSRYPSPQALKDSIEVSKPGFITVSLTRSSGDGNAFYDLLNTMGVPLVPNTAGCHRAKEACTIAHMARELLNTNWIKLEIIGDDETQAPNSFELVKAAKDLLDDGFVVLAYCTEDLSLCSKLAELGCHAIMPWASPIGSGQGIVNPERLAVLRDRLRDSVLIVDAGIGRPSDAVLAMELGYDAVLLNTAVALARDPSSMARSFSEAVVAGRNAWHAGIIPKRELAQPSTLAPDIPVEYFKVDN